MQYQNFSELLEPLLILINSYYDIYTSSEVSEILTIPNNKELEEDINKIIKVSAENIYNQLSRKYINELKLYFTLSGLSTFIISELIKLTKNQIENIGPVK